MNGRIERSHVRPALAKGVINGTAKDIRFRHLAKVIAQLNLLRREVIASFHRGGELDLAVTGEQRNAADFAQIHPDGVVKTHPTDVEVDALKVNLCGAFVLV